MLVALALAVALATADYAAPAPSGDVLLLETFQDAWETRWVHSKKEVYSGAFAAEGYKIDAIPGDVGLTMPKKAHRYGISHKLPTPIQASVQPLVVQYEVSLKGGLECGGAYVKLLNVDSSFEPTQFDEPTPYSIMFGPDKCANAGKIHFIFKFKNPVTGEWVEHHLVSNKSPPMPPTSESVVMTHLYRFALLPGNKLTISIDLAEPRTYSLLDDFEPPINPPAEIDDPTDLKPADWVDAKMVADPAATKPDDWDEDAPFQIADPKVEKPAGWHDDAPLTIADPSSAQPADWDSAEDGDWEAPKVANPLCSSPGCGEWKAPLVENPAYKGKWFAPMIVNPGYKGEFTPKRIANPSFFVDLNPAASLSPIGAVGFELWTMDEGTLFDNLLFTRDLAVADDFASKTWAVRHAVEAAAKAELAPKDGPASDSLVDKVVYYGQLLVVRALENPKPTALALFLVLSVLLTTCFIPWSQKTPPKAQRPATPSAAPAAAQDKGDDDAKDDAKPSSKAKVTKRTPKVTE